MDGYIKIKTKIDNKDVDKGVAELENKIKKLEEDNSKSSTEQNSLQEEIKNYEQLQKKADEYKNKIQELKAEKDAMISQFNGKIPHSQMVDYSLMQNELDTVNQKYAQTTAEIDKQAPKIEKIYTKLDKIKSKQVENNTKINEFKQKIEQINLNKIQNSLNSVGKNIQTQIGKIGKMAFAIVGLRTAWGAVRSAITTVSRYNPQIATDIAYIQYVLANTLLPVIQKIISFAQTLLGYINAIMSAWFGINLFGNSSVENFKKMQSSASGTAKSAREIKKSLQGFDEINVLSDNSDTSTNSGGTVTPSVDLSGMEGNVPAWLQWILDNKNLILSTIAGIIAGLIGFKALNLAASLGVISQELVAIKALGIGVMIAGIVYIIQSLMDYLQSSSWENFGKIIQGIGIAIVGLGALIGSVPVAVAGAIVLIVGTITKYWNEIKNFFQEGIDWLTGQSNWVHEMFGDVVGNIYDTIVSALQLVLNIFDNVFTSIKGMFDGLIMFITGVFSGDWQKAWEGIKKIFSSIWEGLKGIVTSVWNYIKSLVINIATSVGNVISSAFKAVVNGVLGAIEKILNSPINAINGLIGIINKVPGINLGKLNTFNLPRLARGGVISQPTQAIIGEAGTEAVVPLENNLEWLDILATMLANKLNTDRNTNVYLDGRLIQRQIDKRKQQLAFAKNGG